MIHSIVIYDDDILSQKRKLCILTVNMLIRKYVETCSKSLKIHTVLSVQPIITNWAAGPSV